MSESAETQVDSNQAQSRPAFRTAPDPNETGFPRGVAYIIGNEAAERFSFYGMRTILVVFMTKYLHLMSGDVATEVSGAQANEWYHNFVAATYLFPVLGSLLSDIFIGKYRTILSLSIVYCVGHLALALMGGAGLSPAMWLFLGLGLIALGSGGIKPCVSAHVGDQFGPGNSHLMTKVFQWFYFSINFGSTVSTALTPVLLNWYGPHVAFGVPGVLMAIATLLFWMGRHVFIHVPAGGFGFFKETFSREGLLALLKLSIIYAFVAVFWAVFDQTGSSWVLQAENMDRNFLGVEWLQSQIQVINPILVMILIPVFQFVLYPAIDRVFKLTSIRKMAIGFFLTSASFWLVTRGQALIDSGSTPSIAWQLWAYLLLTSGEIMISITGLEFSYTQAPRTMKSVVMAVWLLSVSLGNIFTSTVNHSIQTPGIGQVTAEAASAKIDTPLTAGTWKYSVSDRRSADDSQKGRTIRVFGADNTADTADDVTIDLDEYDVVTSITTIDNDVLEQAAQLVDDRFFQSANDDADKSLPNTEAGQLLLQDLRDSQGLPLVYKQVTRNQYRITTAGGDSTHQTQWDIVLTGQVTRVDQNKTDSPEQAPLTWLEKRIIEIKGERGREEVQRARGNIASTEVGHDITVGGQDTLEGADYFEFWTITTLITAVLFIPVGYLYKEKSYIQSTDDESADESLSGQAGTTSHEESGNDSDPEF